MKKTALFFLLFLATTLFAQKKDFTMQEAVNGLSSTLAPLNLKQLKWTGDEKYFSHVVTNNGQEHVVRYSIADFNADTLINLAQLNRIVADSFGKLTKMPTLNWMEGYIFYYSNNNTYVKVDVSKDIASKMYTLPADAENETIHASNYNIAYTVNNNIFINKVGEAPIQITNDGSTDILNGTSVHRDEFGINGGLFWSNKGNKLAYYKMDQSMVTNYPIIDWKTIPATVKQIKYPFAGNASHHVKLLSYSLPDNKTTVINTEGPADQYLTCVTWGPDDQHIYIGKIYHGLQ
jgi:dipeptidyl-peptidase-4